jgi:hypothetical protein
MKRVRSCLGGSTEHPLRPNATASPRTCALSDHEGRTKTPTTLRPVWQLVCLLLRSLLTWILAVDSLAASHLLIAVIAASYYCARIALQIVA